MRKKIKPPITLLCTGCGYIEVPFDTITALHCADTDEMTVAFQCPECHIREVANIADYETLDALLAYGMHLHIWDLPLWEHRTPNLPDITTDDLKEAAKIVNNQPLWDEFIAKFGVTDESAA